MRGSPSETLNEVVRELDLVVFQLERQPPSDEAARAAERNRLRRELERLKEILEDLAGTL
jgi:hypothetical protein